jgi:Biotin-lipoyl like
MFAVKLDSRTFGPSKCSTIARATGCSTNSLNTASNPSFIPCEATTTILAGANGAALPNRTRRTDWSSDNTEWAHPQLIHQLLQPTSDRHAFPQDRNQDNKPQRRWSLFVLGSVVVLTIIGGVVYWLMARNLESTDDAYNEGNAVAFTPKVSGYITQLNIDDNTIVHAGDLLLNIDPRDYIAARALAYRGTVLNALQEVEDALVVYRTDRAGRNRLMEAVKSGEVALHLARDRYTHGLAAGCGHQRGAGDRDDLSRHARGIAQRRRRGAALADPPAWGYTTGRLRRRKPGEHFATHA